MKQITVRWLISNETKSDNSSTIRVRNQDFWRTEPLVEQSSFNGSILSTK
jgi:hypothetical protein